MSNVISDASIDVSVRAYEAAKRAKEAIANAFNPDIGPSDQEMGLSTVQKVLTVIAMPQVLTIALKAVGLVANIPFDFDVTGVDIPDVQVDIPNSQNAIISDSTEPIFEVHNHESHEHNGHEHEPHEHNTHHSHNHEHHKNDSIKSLTYTEEYQKLYGSSWRSESSKEGTDIEYTFNPKNLHDLNDHFNESSENSHIHELSSEKKESVKFSLNSMSNYADINFKEVDKLDNNYNGMSFTEKDNFKTILENNGTPGVIMGYADRISEGAFLTDPTEPMKTHFSNISLSSHDYAYNTGDYDRDYSIDENNAEYLILDSIAYKGDSYEANQHWSGQAQEGLTKLQIIMHESAHGIGEAHLHDGNVIVDDNPQHSVMSYEFSRNITYRAGDIEFMQDLYGENHEHNHENTTYKFSDLAVQDPLKTIGEDNKIHASYDQSIWDGGGIDTIDVSGFDGKANITLQEGTENNTLLETTELYGFDTNITLAKGADIENAKFSYGEAEGNHLDNRLEATSCDANSKYTGGGGKDVFVIPECSSNNQIEITDYNPKEDDIELPFGVKIASYDNGMIHLQNESGQELEQTIKINHSDGLMGDGISVKSKFDNINIDEILPSLKNISVNDGVNKTPLASAPRGQGNSVGV